MRETLYNRSLPSREASRLVVRVSLWEKGIRFIPRTFLPTRSTTSIQLTSLIRKSVSLAGFFLRCDVFTYYAAILNIDVSFNSEKQLFFDRFFVSLLWKNITFILLYRRVCTIYLIEANLSNFKKNFDRLAKNKNKKKKVCE